MMINFPPILSENVEPVVILLSVINLVVLHVKKRSVRAYSYTGNNLGF